MTLRERVFSQIIEGLDPESDTGTVVSWQPFPDSPQLDAYHSEADELFYGGAAGGGKSDLLLGLAGTSHQRSVIFRREFPRIRSLIERSREIYNFRKDSRDKDSYNESLHIWRLANGRHVEFAACQYETDKENQRGRPRDFYGFDEITEFTESQYRFITAWNRSSDPNQRCRVVCTGNPPTTAEGEWVIQYWGAWLDPNHKNPAQPGELRYYIRKNDQDIEVDSPESFEEDGVLYTPRSRTFIPARLQDNPILMRTDYYATLNNLPEPLRSQMLEGNFGASIKDDVYQVIPTAWVLAAQARWESGQRPDMRLRALGVDVARGGDDDTVIVPLYGNWFDDLIAVSGRDTPTGDSVADLIEPLYEAGVNVNIDSVGVGASAYDAAVNRFGKQDIHPINAGAGSKALDKSERFGFANIRAEMWWKFREALDPESGIEVALPPNRRLRIDLTTPRYRLRGAKYYIESKDEIYKRIQRSTDYADAVIQAWHEAADRVKTTIFIS